ncbi:MAG: hypothetical protein SOT71_13080 [Romboutsia timonensis]|uniref:hypothetical protein n=1 Tax=Romboutsia timonensis TaxID=1776391 RepID=UPI002A753B1E|nr:hypothetical protein [Romboutsia timonensis]MDY2883577.1 hypothetical protein [Romboutsia timonensis]
MENIYKTLEKMNEVEICESKAQKAYLNTLMKIKNEYDLFYYLASMNLLNAYVKKDYASQDFKHNYIFKLNLADTLENIVKKNFKNVNLYIGSDVVYIDIFNVQFSFHNIKYSTILNNYKLSSKNKVQVWKGIRLQSIASELYDIVENKYITI